MSEQNIILVVECTDNSSRDFSETELNSFCDRLQEKREVLKIHDPMLVASVHQAGFNVEAVVVNFNRETDAAFATMVNGFFGNCPHLSIGAVTPPGFSKIEGVNGVLAALDPSSRPVAAIKPRSEQPKVC